MGELRFDGQVAVVTGAGGGLGREYALLLASRGAAVVVNDLGSSREGEGAASSAADQVVTLIKEAGGCAVANYDSVENGDRIIESAIANFGRIDILINNAGFLRDKSFAKMTIDDWDMIHRVHLRAVFVTTQAAWHHFRRQKYGRIVLTSSAAGVFGNFGQANYSAAKCALVGLGRTLCLEGERYNIKTNVLVPAAASRLTADLVPDHLLQLLQPRLVAPVVLLLSHSCCPVSGAVLEAAGGTAALYRIQRGASVAAPSPERLLTDWPMLQAGFEGSSASTPNSAAEQMMILAQQLETLSAGERKQSELVSSDEAGGVLLPETRYQYGPELAILYALGVGVSVGERHGLRYLYEEHGHFSPHPMFACLLMNALPVHALTELPNVQIDLSQLLHGEHHLEVNGSLPPSADLRVKSSVLDVVDKGSGKAAIIIIKVEAFDDTKDKTVPLVVQQASLFVRGAGGFGGPKTSVHLRPLAATSDKAPDLVLSFTTTVDQAALYRLTGDKNPLHIDPEFAVTAAGQSAPILHGLCVLGACVHRVVREGAGAQRVRRVGGRFSRPALPGDRMVIDVWTGRTEEHVLEFRTRSASSDHVVISGGYVEFWPSPCLESDRLFDQLNGLPVTLHRPTYTMQYNIMDDTESVVVCWVLEVRDNTLHVSRQLVITGADVIFCSDDVTASLLLSARHSVQETVSSGSLAVDGDPAGMHVLQSVIAPSSKL